MLLFDPPMVVWPPLGTTEQKAVPPFMKSKPEVVAWSFFDASELTM
jgi:hypothetical protein